MSAIIRDHGVPELYCKLLILLDKERKEGKLFPISFIYAFFHLWNPVERAWMKPENKE